MMVKKRALSEDEDLPIQQALLDDESSSSTNNSNHGRINNLNRPPSKRTSSNSSKKNYHAMMVWLLLVGFLAANTLIGGGSQRSAARLETKTHALVYTTSTTSSNDRQSTFNNMTTTSSSSTNKIRGRTALSAAAAAATAAAGGHLPPIQEQSLKVIAPNHPNGWTDEAVHAEFQHALTKIRDAPIIHEPFDHFFVKDLFSDKFYTALMEELPPPKSYQPARYPGTDPKYKAYQVAASKIGNGTHVHIPTDCGENKKSAACWKQNVQLHSKKATKGLTLTVDQDASRYPLWVQAFRLIHSRNFTHLLYSKFATDTGIPQYKQEAVKNQTEPGSDEIHLRNTAALRIEPTSYHLTPHVDRYEKLVTWQYFHPQSMELVDRGVGTQFYKIKSEYADKFEIQDIENPNWLDYKYFDSVKEQPVVPNYFFSFAPNTRSWHGAAIDPTKMAGVSDTYARRTFLGFITTKFWEYHHFNKGDWAPEEFDFTAL